MFQLRYSETEVMGALPEITKFSGTLKACEKPETENNMRSIVYGIAVVIKLSSGSLTYRSVNFGKVLQKEGLSGLSGSPTRDLSHPKDQQAGDVKYCLRRVFCSSKLVRASSYRGVRDRRETRTEGSKERTRTLKT